MAGDLRRHDVMERHCDDGKVVLRGIHTEIPDIRSWSQVWLWVSTRTQLLFYQMQLTATFLFSMNIYLYFSHMKEKIMLE